MHLLYHPKKLAFLSSKSSENDQAAVKKLGFQHWFLVILAHEHGFQKTTQIMKAFNYCQTIERMKAGL